MKLISNNFKKIKKNTKELLNPNLSANNLAILVNIKLDKLNNEKKEIKEEKIAIVY